ncbi:MAG: phosphoglucosamine mutase [Thermus sp.]|uniref:phosphoglucosamine mutase n=1 Tax=unclassified Thermus TaxID=2619321 RepID=UPI00023898E8|nr:MULTISPECIES: phosphoglucosamine mutase [unclassified Thermus]AEV16471.1 Phosphoglucosamine mutase [Thermus sp. CCB_US3_UF1]MCS6868062.1 phosphoglucosamine mutase [Thermus sp.]MCS7217575.1 phosphoglucosamine mutase [Thermus sp.]MCX7849433.1 phosphoglucosamine mutase [Thermus sp.]MDW8017673.1 phosphoglucosamine mutase [Thermus sp.]
MRRYFGTDGVRGEAGKPPLTPEFVLKLGQAAGAYFRKQEARPVVLLAKDTRESSDLLEAALAAGLLSQGVRVEHLGVLPTPGVAYLTKALGATAGAMISASHNPYQDNGIKFFGPTGEKLPDEAEAEVEALLEEAHPTRGIGTVGDFREAERMYLDFLLAHAPDLTGLRLGLDLAHGATYRLGPKLFQRAGAEVMAFFNTPDGRNINKGCGSTHPEALARFVVELGLDLGIAFDGDGDRVQFLDRKGRLFHGDHILYLAALAYGERGVVGTVMSNMGLEVALKERGIAFHRAAVGDRYVLETLKAQDLSLGGEPSGHVIFRRHHTTGDGLLTALLTLKALKALGGDLADWYQALPMFPQVLLNVRVADKAKVMAHPRLKEALEEAEARLGGRGRVNVRPSGTEPVVRVMVEAEEGAEALAQELAHLVAALDRE